MSVMEAEVYEAFKAIGVPDEKASAAAQALSRPKPEVSTLAADLGALKLDFTMMRSDIVVMKSDIAVLKSDVGVLKTDVASLKTSMAVLQWGVGITIASVLSLVAKAFLH